MADDNLNDALAGVNIECEESEDEDGDPAELVNEASTDCIKNIIDELSLLSIGDMKEVHDALTLMLKDRQKNKKKEKTKATDKHYKNWYAERAKWYRIPKPEVFSKKVGEMEGVPTYYQWHAWNNSKCYAYKADRWAVDEGGTPVRNARSGREELVGTEAGV
tara:strand:- start:150 stop:635 length:486 start_codon:yes stop_codon:yes gene_type:complete